MTVRKISALVLALLAAGTAQAAPVVINAASTTSYTQSFDALTTSTTASTWANDSSLAGWSLFTGAGAAITTHVAGTGSSNTGSFYSFGTGTNSERALGSAASGGAYFGSPANDAPAGFIALALTNAGTSAISNFTLSYDGEQWRNGGNTTAQSLTVQYGFGSSFAAVTSWTAAGSAFNFTSPIATATAAALDGNAAANRVAGLGGSVATNWAAGTTLWVRWTDLNDAGTDHGLAIDNLSFSVPAATITPEVPEPTSGVIALAGLGVAGLVARRRRAA
jgi:hypothetical protein